MPVNTDAVGKTFPPAVYAVGREKVREYAHAVGETNPLHLDVEAARAAGHKDVVAPPMFAVVYTSPAIGPAFFDPDVGMDFARMVHGAQEFAWGPLVVAGDEIATGIEVTELKVTPDRYLTYRYAGASGDFNPIHIDDEFARSVGLPGRILHGLWSMAQVARAQTEAAGGPGKLRRLSVRFRGMGVPEQEVVVTSTRRDEVDGIATVDVEARQGDSRIVRRGIAEIDLS